MISTTFSSDRLQRLSEIEGNHFWFKGRRALIDNPLGTYITNHKSLLLDLGCGTGDTIVRLAKRGFHPVGIDIRSEGLQTIKHVIPYIILLQADGIHIPIAHFTFDLAILLDVIEHIDDRVLFSEIARVMKSNGFVIFSAPAIPWLWSFRDQATGHRKRYSRNDIERLVADIGFKLLDLRYYQFFLFPILFLFRILGRLWGRMRDIEEIRFPIITPIFTFINVIEVRIGYYLKYPWGSSIIAVCRKGKV